jgi:hypothetical protein
MKTGRSLLGLGALAILVALAGIVVTALPGHLPTGGLVVLADNCVMSGQATVVNGVFTCDCTIIGGSNCGCIVAGKCPPGALEEENGY